MKYIHKASLLLSAFWLMGSTFGHAETITIFVGGGSYGDAQIEAFVKPFEQETGIQVNAVRSEMPFAKWSMAVETNTVDFDVGVTSHSNGLVGAKRGYYVPIDYSIYDPKEIEAFGPSLRYPWGIAGIVGAFALSFNTETLPEDKRPKNWADFWNVKDFPGNRTLHAMVTPSYTPLEEALLADGVAVEDLYPLDVKRAFRKLDEIKPHIRKWWESASEAMQLFNAKIVDMGINYDGRIAALKKGGVPVDLTYNQAKYYGAFWAIPKGAKNVAGAQKFIEFATRGKQQARMAIVSGFSPANTNAYADIPDDVARTLVTSEENIKRAYPLNAEWYAEVGEDGKMNSERIMEMWNDWIIK
jgi:putative spermidine/putrescine transport system substrate-binding protein